MRRLRLHTWVKSGVLREAWRTLAFELELLGGLDCSEGAGDATFVPAVKGGTGWASLESAKAPKSSWSVTRTACPRRRTKHGDGIAGPLVVAHDTVHRFPFAGQNRDTRGTSWSHMLLPVPGCHMPGEKSPSVRTEWSTAWTLLAGLAITLDVVKHLLLFVSGPAEVELDAGTYWSLGGLIAEGDLWLQQVDNAHRTPGYPAFIAIFRATLGEHALCGLIATQHLFSVLTSLLTGWICWRVTGRPWGAVCGWLISALCLTRPWFAGAVLTETLFTFLLTLHVACVVAYLHRPGRLLVLAVGITLAGSLLVRPVMLLWWPVLALLLWGTNPPECRKQVRQDVLWSGVVLVLLVAPWVARNAMLYGEPFLTRFVGRELWITTFPPDAGASLPLPDSPEVDNLRELAALAGGEVDLRHNWTVSRLYAAAGVRDDVIDGKMQEIAGAAIRRDPARFAWFACKRGVNFWRCVVREFPFFPWDGQVHLPGQAGWGRERVGEQVASVLQWVPARSVWFNTLAAVAALTGGVLLVLCPQTRAVGLLLLALLFYVNGVTAVLEIPNARYRFVLEPALISCGVCGWATLGRCPRGWL